MNAVNWLFAAEQATGEHSEAIRWWELRRIPYNLIVGAVGIASVVVMELIGGTIVQPGEDFVEPLGLLLGVVLLGVVANVGYTLGWILELRMPNGDPEKHRAFRIRSFRRGLRWSCALASLPTWLSLFAWLIHKVTG